MAIVRIAFTACSKINFDAEQPVWLEMAAQKPDHLLLLGDQIYMDYWRDRHKTSADGLKGYELDEPATIPDDEFRQQMRLRYQLQFRLPSFQALIRQVGAKGGTVSMVWDDHDFGFNNSYGIAGDSNDGVISPDKKRISRQLFEEFRINVEKLRAGTHGGGYQTLPQPLAGDPGVQQVFTLGSARVVMLDTRNFRAPPAATPQQLLGPEQWAQLENEIRNAPQPLIIIGSGSPLTVTAVLSDQSWKQDKSGKLAAYKEYGALAALVKNLGKRIVFIGGDSHKIDLLPDATSGLVEIVCAGAAAPKGPLFLNGRHFGLLDINDAGDAQVNLFKRGKVKISGPLFGQAVAGAAIQALPVEPVPDGQPRWQRGARERPTTAFMISMRRRLPNLGDGQDGFRFDNHYEPLTCWVTEKGPGQWANTQAWTEVQRPEFISALVQQLEKNADAGRGNQLCVYAHGALHDWLDTAKKFATIVNPLVFAPSTDGKQPGLGLPLFVSWPASKTIEIVTDLDGVYDTTLANTQKAGKDLAAFLVDLLQGLPDEALKAGRLPLTLLASSIGNQVLGAALKELHSMLGQGGPRDIFMRWVMLAADLDSTVFAENSRDTLLAEAIADLCLDVVAATLPQDPVLAKVQVFSGGVARVGQVGFVAVKPEYASWAHAISVERVVPGASKHGVMLDTPAGAAFTRDALSGMSVLELQRKYP